MNDLDLLREFRADVPAATQARLAAGRARLLASGLPCSRRGRRLRGALIPLSAAAAVAAVALGATAVNSRSAVHTPGEFTVAGLTDRAAAARQPEVRPGQWVYRKTIANNPLWDHNDPHFYTSTIWSTADYSKSASFWQGKLWIHHTLPYMYPLVPYNAIGSLPADPRALANRLEHLSGSPQWPFGYTIRLTPETRAFEIIATMLQCYIMPPKFTAVVRDRAVVGAGHQPMIVQRCGCRDRDIGSGNAESASSV